MNKIEVIVLDKKDTKQFKTMSNKSFIRFIFYAFKNIFKRDEFKRYLSKAKSIRENKRKKDYPALIKQGKRIAVYTALFGDYDEIKEIKKTNRQCDYFIFTDQIIPDNSGWKKREFEFPDEIKNDNTLKNRYLKTHPHLLFPDYEYSIYLDSVFVIRLDIMRLMGRMGEKIFGLFHHHANVQCSYVEADRVKRLGLAPREIVEEQVNSYKNEGFPKNFGFFECGCIVRKHNDLCCVNVMNTWWNEIYFRAHRDQLSFTYSLWKNGCTIDDVANLGLTFWIEPVLLGIGHKKKNAEK